MADHAPRELPGEDLGTASGRRGQALTPVRIVAGALGGIALLGGLGWIAWAQGALVGLRWVEFDAPLSMAALGFVSGIGAFFAPCAFALFPGYISYSLAATEEGGVRRSLGLGLACAGGSVIFFALMGVAVTLLGGVLSAYLIATKPFIALGVVGLGVVMLSDVRMPSLALPWRTRGDRETRGLPLALGVSLYGFGYALASTGCTLPLYVSITVIPLTSGYSGAALVTFLSFALAMALLMLITSLLVGLAKVNLLRTLRAGTVWIKRANGLVLILAGLYLGYFYLRAGM